MGAMYVNCHPSRDRERGNFDFPVGGFTLSSIFEDCLFLLVGETFRGFTGGGSFTLTAGENGGESEKDSEEMSHLSCAFM